MKNIIINNGTATVTVNAAHNVTVSENQITIDLVKTTVHKTSKLTTKTKTKTTSRKRGRPAKAKA